MIWRNEDGKRAHVLVRVAIVLLPSPGRGLDVVERGSLSAPDGLERLRVGEGSVTELGGQDEPPQTHHLVELGVLDHHGCGTKRESQLGVHSRSKANDVLATMPRKAS